VSSGNTAWAGCEYVGGRRPGTAVIVIGPTAAVIGSTFFVISQPPAGLVGMGQYIGSRMLWLEGTFHLMFLVAMPTPGRTNRLSVYIEAQAQDIEDLSTFVTIAMVILKKHAQFTVIGACKTDSRS